MRRRPEFTCCQGDPTKQTESTRSLYASPLASHKCVTRLDENLKVSTCQDMKEFAPQPESDDDFWGGENKAKSTEERTAEISKSPRPTETVADKVEPKTETITNGTNVPAGAIDYVPRQSQSRQSFRNRPGSARSIHSPRNSAQVTQPPPPKLLEKLPEVSRKSESSEKFSSDESQAESEADVKSPKYSEAFDSEPEDKMTQISKEKISVTAVKSEKKLVKKSPVKTVKKVAKESTSNSMQTSKSTEILTTKTSKKTKGENSSLKVRSLQDEITYLKTQLEDLSQENRTMKQIQKRQERQILHNDRTGAVSSDVHNVLETHAEETRYLREHLKKQQEKNRENDRILRERNDALQQALAKVKRLEDLLHKKGIDPKAKPKAKDAELLQTQLEEERKRSQVETAVNN